MKRITHKHVLQIKPYQPGKPIEEVKRELGLKNVIKLASNESPFGPSPKVLAAMQKALLNVNRYPEGGCFYLRRELSRRLSLAPEQFVFGNGSDEVIVLALRAFAGEGDEVVIAKPSFLVYDIAARAVGAKVRAVPLKDFRYDLAGMAKAVTAKTKIVFIGNPDNPAGTFVTERELKKFLKDVPSGVLVFVDEAYYEYAVREPEYPDTLSLLGKHKNLLVTRTFSKLYGLAGLRVGYGMSNPETIGILNRLREPFNINSVAQAGAVACLQDARFYKDIAGTVEEQKEYLYAECERQGLDYKKTATNFILIDLKKKAAPVVGEMIQRGVIVRDMTFWGLETFIRISVGAPEENKKCMAALQKVLNT